jgi:flagella basal body P-ring formation protein FlgA
MLACALLCAQGAPAHAALSVALKARAEVAAQQYRLGDVAEIGGAEEGLARRVRDLVVGEAVSLGHDETVSRAAIAKAVDAGFPELRGQFAWSGAAAVRIHWQVAAIQGEEIIEAARQALAQRLRAAAQQAQLTPVSELRPVAVPAGGRTVVQARALPAAEHQHLSKRMVVWVDLMNDGRLVRSVPVWFAVSVPARVWVLRRPADAGAPLRADMLQEEERDLATVGGMPLGPDALRGGQRLRKALGQGAALTAGDVEAAPPVERNGKVVVRSKAGTVSIESVAVAAEDGRLGQLVRVFSGKERHEYEARVAGPGLVTVE